MYEWQRFWIPSSSAFSLGDDGFLYDPEAEYGPQINPNAVPFSDLHAKNCLVLLGEPGIGKSIAIQREVATCRNSFAASDELISIDLGEYGDESRVIEDVFKAPAVANWATGSHLLHLFLDSLDECGLQVAHVAKILRNELAKLKPHLSRLRLRIVCRTADWPASLTTALNDLWNETPEVYELLPLRRRDIASAASEKECDADEFVDELIRVGAQSLAIKPVTLEFLISAYKSDHGFPSRQAELYSRGCHLLCEETNQGRRDAKQVGRLTSQRRFVVAQRIAAALILGNKSSIRLGLSVHEQSPTSLDVADLIGGVEILNWERFEVGAPEIEEALRTGLFSGRGQGRVGFAHHTYAEFLTAGYLASRVRRLSDRMNLLRNADDTEGKIVPQLAETAAWLAGMDAKAFDEIMLCDPQILVRSDVAKADASDRKLLIQRLLDLFAADEIREAGWEEHLHYHKLNHEGLSAQLTTVICDRSKGLSVRRFAISVAQDCARRDLQSLLADRALDTTEGYAVRVRAAYAVVAIGDGASQLRLKPLALETSPGDEDFTLKALVLRTLWPKYITAEELFQNLTVPEQGTYGTYRHFLNYELPDQLTAAQVPQALRWVITLSDAELQEHSIRPLIEKMSRLAWTHLDDPDVRAAMAAFAIVRLRGHDDIVPMDTDGVDDQPGHRRMLVETIVREMGDLGSHLTGLIYLPPRLLGRSDTLWLLTKITEERDDDKIEHWVGLIEHLFNPMTPGHLDAALRVCEKIPKLDAALRPQYQAIALDSEEAKRLRKQYEHFEELRRRVDEGRNPPPLDPPPDIRIQQHLSASEAGDAEAWFRASYDLELEPNSTHYMKDLEHDLTTLPGWIQADRNTRSRLVAGAVRFLNDHRAGDEWLGTDSTPFRALAGYKAIFLIHKESPDQFRSLTPDVWERWAPIIVDFHGFQVAEEDQKRHVDIARTCVAEVPSVVAECLKRVVLRGIPDGQTLILPDFVERAWCEAIERTLLETATSESVDPRVLGTLLEVLLKHRCDEVIRPALAMLTLPVPTSGVGRKRAVVTAKALLHYAEDAGWDAVWPALQSDLTFGRTVIESVAMQDMHNASIVMRLSERDAAALYVWITKQYPHESDEKRSGPFVGTRDAIGHYRDSLLRGIQYRGTTNAIDALLWIATQLPELEWMKWVIAGARQTTLQATWRPLGAKEVIALAQAPNGSLVRSAAELQDVILESLESLQITLQGETPAARDLWDKGDGSKFKPVDENDLSNYIKRHLERDLRERGIVALREVEIRRGEGKGDGERTDLHVTGVVPGLKEETFDQVRVIIEVKGPWHPEVDTAMQTQLVDRYLRDNPCQHGIYLVAWFRCPQWDETSWSYKKSRKETLEAASRRFASQAEELSSKGRRIKSFVLNAALR